MLTLLARLLKALNSETGAWALAFAFVLGMIVGFTPFWRVHNIFILLFALIFRVNLSAFLLTFALCTGLAYLLDPLFHELGSAWLSAPAWQGVWETLYASPWWRLTQFHHSITLGSVMVAIALSPFVALGGYWLVVNYRQRVQQWFYKLKVVQGLRASKFWNLYTELRG